MLIVDDRESERDILTKVLGKFSAEIVTAKSGPEALSLLLRHEFTLVLLDINMPGMDGLETATLMRGSKNSENTPIIFMTAYDRNDIEMMQGYKLRAIDYLFKPIHEEILLSKVDSFLRSFSFEKEKDYEKILKELESQNRQLKRAQDQALRMMQEAEAARKIAEASQQKIEAQANELVKYTRELEQFAYVATHDLRAPIINLVRLMEVFNRKGFVTKENTPITTKISNSIDRINTSLNDLITVIQSTRDRELRAEKLLFEKVFAETLKDLEAHVKERNAAVSLDFSGAPEIHYSSSHLRSIAQNLLINAIKYVPGKRKPKIEVRTEVAKDGVHLLVKDNGVGIDPLKKDKVFGLFQRLAYDSEGKGMGLYIVKSQLETHGGAIDFDSTPGKGTEFKVFMKNFKKLSADEAKGE